MTRLSPVSVERNGDSDSSVIQRQATSTWIPMQSSHTRKAFSAETFPHSPQAALREVRYRVGPNARSISALGRFRPHDSS
jgi:hypothetical protein